MQKLVIIPTYNERENIAAMVEKVMSLEGDFDLLVIDDGSPDGTAEVVRSYIPRYGERLHLLERSGKLGLGTAYLMGFRWGLEQGYDLLAEMDCDFSHNPDDLTRLVAAIEEGADVAIGSRYVRGVNVVNWPMGRLLTSYFGSKYVRTITRMPIHDTTAGFVCYTRKALERIDLDAIGMKGYGFQIEMKYTAWRLGLKLREVSIIFTERREGASKMSGGIVREALFGVIGLCFKRIKPKA
ncbi:MAG: polyprenol monophosphomannose synthase [Alistipes sp.]|nr:polyprenol monophosphomannose synthase [Alistipes sp.]